MDYQLLIFDISYSSYEKLERMSEQPNQLTLPIRPPRKIARHQSMPSIAVRGVGTLHTKRFYDQPYRVFE